TSASAMFDFPDPFGPTTTATPGSRRTSTWSGNDLNPRMRTAFRYTRGNANDQRGWPGLVRQFLSGQRLERLLRSLLLGFLLRRAGADATLLAVDQRSAGEAPVVCGALRLEHRVDDLLAQARKHLLQLGLVVDGVRGGVLDLAAEGRDDRLL